MALETLQAHIEKQGQVLEHSFTRVERLTVQVVAGKKYTFVVSYTHNSDESRVRLF